MAVKNAHFMGKFTGYPRTRWEPMEITDGFPTAGYQPYMVNPKDAYYGRPVWLCYCVVRYDWLIRTMAEMGVNTKCLGPKSRKVTKKQCRKIASALKEWGERHPYNKDRMLIADIKFFRHCGGIKIHNWAKYNN